MCYATTKRPVLSNAESTCTCISCNLFGFWGQINQSIKANKQTNNRHEQQQTIKIPKSKQSNRINLNAIETNKITSSIIRYVESCWCIHKSTNPQLASCRQLYWQKQCVHTHFRCPICYPRMDHWPYKRMLKVHSPAIRAMSFVACSWWMIPRLRPEHKGAFSKTNKTINMI